MKSFPYKKVLVTLLVALTFTAIAYAATTLWSNEVSVNVSEYTLTLNDPADGTTLDSYTFTGTVLLGGDGVLGETVNLYVDDGTGYVDTGLSDVTVADGSFSIVWSTIVAGSYTFKFKADI